MSCWPAHFGLYALSAPKQLNSVISSYITLFLLVISNSHLGIISYLFGYYLALSVFDILHQIYYLLAVFCLFLSITSSCIFTHFVVSSAPVWVVRCTVCFRSSTVIACCHNFMQTILPSFVFIFGMPCLCLVFDMSFIFIRTYHLFDTIGWSWFVSSCLSVWMYGFDHSVFVNLHL